MSEIQRIHHVAVLVQDLDASLKFWQDILKVEPSMIVDVPVETARIAFLPFGETEIELVQPTTPDSSLSRYLDKHGPGLHHLCFEVDDIESWLLWLKKNGITLVNEEPKVGADGRLYAFIHPKSTNGVLVELYQMPK